MGTQYAVQSSWNEERRKAGRNFTCVICSQRYNEADMLFQDGNESLRVCPYHHEPNGGVQARDEDRAAASAFAAMLTEQELRPPKFPGWADGAPVSAVNAFTPEPRTLTRGGGAAVLTIDGTGFLSTDTITYGHAGITDSVAPSVSDEQVILTVLASISTPLGYHGLEYNDQSFSNVFLVRA